MAKTVSEVTLRREVWAKDLWANKIENMFFTANNLMGSGTNVVVKVVNDLSEKKGNTYTYGLTSKLSGNGISGDATLEGNEEAISAYSQSVSIDQKRNSVLLTGQLDEQGNSYDMRSDAKDKLSVWLQEFEERQIFFKLGGVNNATLTDIEGITVGANCNWSNTPAFIPDADEAAGFGSRYLCANAGGTDALTSSDVITPQLLSNLKRKALTSNPKIQPLKINGKNYFVVFIHPNQFFDLTQNATFAQAYREAWGKGSDNPIFTGADVVWDGMVIYQHPYVPFLDISKAGHSFRGAAVGTDCTADAYRAILCGQDAVVYASCKNPKRWVEKSFDYENQVGFSTGIIGGFQKVMFNSKEYSSIVLDTASSVVVA